MEEQSMVIRMEHSMRLRTTVLGLGGRHDETLSNHDESVGYCVDAMEHYIRTGKCCDGSEVSYDEYGAQG